MAQGQLVRTLSSWVMHALPWLVLLGLLMMQQNPPHMVRMLQLKTFDTYQQLWPRELPEDPPVYVVDADEKSLDALGQWPWPRSIYAELTDKILQAGAVAVGYDILFAEPDRTAPQRISQHWPTTPALEQQLQVLPDPDDALENAIHNKPVVLGFTFAFGHTEAADDSVNFQPPVPMALPQHAYPWLPTASRAIRNLSGLEDKATGMGWFGYIPDPDNIVRRVPTMVRFGEHAFPPLSLELLRLGLNSRQLAGRADEGGMQAVKVGNYVLPTDAHGLFWLKYRPFSDKIYISASDVMDGTVGAETLQNKLVLMGTSAMGLLDLRTTPLESAIPGVDVHVQIIETILAQDFIRRPNWLPTAELFFVLLVGALMIITIERFGAFSAALGFVAITAAVLSSSIYFFINNGLLLDATYPLLALLVIYLLQTVLKYRREEAQRRQIKGTFEQYLSPTLVGQLADHPEQLTLGGEQKELTLLFSDIRGFTTLSEGFAAEELTNFINEYLTPMTDIILEQQGTIDKYMGDAIMAFWNAPLDVPNHAQQSVTAALIMLEKLAEMNNTWQQKGMPKIDVGIGIHTGESCVGNMGSDQRFDYTVLGDAVNLASRLEGSSKYYGLPLIISSDTVAQLDENLVTIPIDRVQVKGKTEPVDVFTVLSRTADHNTKADADSMHKALELFRARKWDDALSCIEQLEHLPTIQALYRKRIAEFKKNPPPPEWNGTTERRSK